MPLCLQDILRLPAGLAVLSALALSATSAAPAADATTIAEAFQDQGMPAEQSRCYGETITESLPPEMHDEAVEIIRTASGQQEIREGVTSGGVEMVQAFLDAETRCGR